LFVFDDLAAAYAWILLVEMVRYDFVLI